MVYKITTYNLIGKVLTTFEPLPNVRTDDSQRVRRFIEPDGTECYKTHLWYYAEILLGNPISHTEKFLPYFADVTEDIARHYKVTPTTYKNCQLMTEKHGGYLQFFHKESNQVLRIALNSHYYTPVKPA